MCVCSYYIQTGNVDEFLLDSDTATKTRDSHTLQHVHKRTTTHQDCHQQDVLGLKFWHPSPYAHVPWDAADGHLSVVLCLLLLLLLLLQTLTCMCMCVCVCVCVCARKSESKRDRNHIGTFLCPPVPCLYCPHSSHLQVLAVEAVTVKPARESGRGHESKGGSLLGRQ